MNRVLQLLVAVIAIAGVVYPSDSMGMVCYGLATIFSLIFTDLGYRRLEVEDFSWRTTWIAAMTFGIAPWALAGLMATMTGVPFDSLTIFLFGVPVGAGFCLGALLSWVFRNIHATFFSIPALAVGLVLVVATIIVKTPFEQRREGLTTIMLSAQIDANHELHHLQAVVGGKAVICVPLKDTIFCGEDKSAR